ncbi:MAG: sugar phosphate nucleotidyltransferase [Verrucomicrobiia bacterium]
MEIKKAVITAAGRNQRLLPLQTVVDRDGQQKSALRILIEETLSAGVEEICVVICPGDEPAYRTAAADHAARLHFEEQKSPLGYGDAVMQARGFAGDDAFLLLVGDHLYLSMESRSCARQLIDVAKAERCAVSAVQATHESKLPYYGAVGGRLVAGRKNVYKVETVIEKPTPTEAEQRLIVPGLRAGHYLCFFGMHVLTPTVFRLLEGLYGAPEEKKTIHLSDALAGLAARERYLACELAGRRYDIGVKYGFMIAQLALALTGSERDEVLTNLVELLALRKV